MFSPLHPLRFDKKPKNDTPQPKAPASPSLYAPAKGVVIHGTPYQGGEQIPSEVVSQLSPRQQDRLHRDPKAAQEAFRKEPSLSKGERLEGAVTPRIGRPVRPDYAEPRVQRPPTTGTSTSKVESAEEGRALLPKDLTSPELVTDEEASELSPRQARNLIRHFNKLPADLEYVAAAKAGRAKRGWYADAAKALHNLFGTDAGRFVALLAATSPQVPVEENLQKAAEIWKFYQEWMHRRAAKGKKDTPNFKEVIQELERWKGRPGREFNPIGSHDNNIALALSSDNPGHTAKVVLSGPKVDSFRRNLLGNLMAATNDVWMSYMGGFKQDEIAGRNAEHPDKPGVKIAKINGEYLANNIKLRRTAQKLNAQLQPGERPWTAAEVQETVWSFFRALAFVGGSSRKGEKTPLDPVQALNTLTHETVHGNADFVTLLFKRNPDGSKNSVVRNLEAAGLGNALVRVFKSHQAAERRKAKTKPSGSVQDALSPDERRAIVPVARRAGQNVRGFMGQTRYSRLRYAATQQPQVMPQPAPAAMPAQAPAAPAMPQAQNPVQAPMQQTQLPPIDEHRENLLAFSPNVDDLSFEDALARTRSGNQKAFKKIISHIGEQIGVKPQTHDAVGDWSDGAENSLLQYFKEPLSPATLDYIGAWYGLLANQKSVLRFQPEHGGLDSVYEIEIPNSDLGQIRKSLDKAGIVFRTLIPTKKGTKIVLYDEKRENRDRVAAWAGQHNATIRESIGQGRYIGGSTRTAARREYRQIITAYEAAAAKSGGSVRAYKPPVKPHHLRTAKEREAAIHQARKGSPIRFASGPLVNPQRLPPVKAREPEEYGGTVEHVAENHPSDIRSGLLFGADLYTRDAIRRLYRSMRGRGDSEAKRARHLLRQLWRGDTDAIEPAIDAVQEAGGTAMWEQLKKEGVTPDFLRTRLLKLANEGPAKRRLNSQYQSLENQYLGQNYPLAELAEDQDMAPAEKPTMGERLGNLGRGVKRVAKKVGQAALRQLPKNVLPQQTRQNLYGWESYVRKNKLPREEVPGYGEKTPPIKPLKMSGIHAPAGGVVVRGLFYPGGKWIPSANLEKASYDQYQHVENQRMKKYRREDGSVSVEPALESEGAKQFAKGSYTPGVDPRVEKIRSALGRGGHPAPSPRPSTPVKPVTSYIGSGLRKQK